MSKTSKEIYHFHHVSEALKKYGLDGGVNMADFTLAVRHKTEVIRLYPQFYTRLPNGTVGYAPVLSEWASGFLGWRPYGVRQWPVATEKLHFKRFCEGHGLATPAYSLAQTSGLEGVLIKRSNGTFSRGIQGPYASTHQAPLSLAEAEFYEVYTPGQLVKLWFFEAQAVAAGIAPMPSLEADGVSTIEQQLRTAERLLGATLLTPETQTFLQHQGHTLSQVLPAGQRFGVDFRYASSMPVSRQGRDVKLGVEPFFGLDAQLAELGQVFFNQAIPQGLQAGVVYVVDAILDAQNKLWLLEMNSNPYIHPYVYDAMIGKIAQQLSASANTESRPSH